MKKNFQLAVLIVFTISVTGCHVHPSGDSTSDSAGLRIGSNGMIESNGASHLEGSSLTFRGVTVARYSGEVPKRDLLFVIRGDRLGVCTRRERNEDYTCTMGHIDERSAQSVSSTVEAPDGSPVVWGLGFAPAAFDVSTLHVRKGELVFTMGQTTSASGWTNVSTASLEYVPSSEASKLPIMDAQGRSI